MKRLKSFEHGDAFITLESNEGNYIVSLYANGQAKRELNSIPDNTFESTCLDAALEIYHKTCQETIRQSDNQKLKHNEYKMNYFKKQAYKRDNPTLKQVYKGREIESAKLAGHFDGMYYAIIDGMLDHEIKPSRYPGIVIRRIKADYYYNRYPKSL